MANKLITFEEFARAYADYVKAVEDIIDKLPPEEQKRIRARRDEKMQENFMSGRTASGL
jgi:hypothetical protein